MTKVQYGWGWLSRLVWVFFFSSLMSSAQVPPEKGTPENPIIVGIDRDFPPFEFVNAEGQPDGYDVDLIRAVASVMGLEIRIQSGLWQDQKKGLETRHLDVLTGMLKSVDRDRFADFTRPHLNIHYSMFMRKNDAPVSSLEALRHRTVLVGEGTQMHEHLRSLGFDQEIQTTDTEPDALRLLAAGKGTAALVPHLAGMLLIHQNRLKNVRHVGGPLLEREACLAVQEGDHALRAKLDTGLAILNQSGEYDLIYNKWFGVLKEDQRGMRRLLRLAAFILLALAGLVIIVLVWNTFLRRKVMARTRALDTAIGDLKKSEAFLTHLLDRIPLILFAKNPKKNFEYSIWNAKAQEVTGFSREEILNHSDFDVFPEATAKAFRLDDHRILEDGKVEILEEVLPTRHQGARLVRTHKYPLLDEDGHPILILGISEDITEQKKQEMAMQQTQRLESLGVLAGGIAHDFNNLLTAIMGHLNLVQLQHEGHPETLQHLNSIETAVLRAATLAKQMLAYSGRGSFVIAPLNLNGLVGEIAHLLNVSIPVKIRREIRLAEKLPMILADESQIQQLVMNLVTNASEAIGNKEGLIRIMTRELQLDAEAIQLQFTGQELEPGSYVCLEVSDTGCGISPDTMTHLFEPFFTTKFTGRGLGLSALLGIIKAHHGAIQVNSEVGKGSTFSVYLPALALERQLSGEAPKPAAFKSHRVLLAEDEEIVRVATVGMLESMGLDVVAACDGQEAVDVFIEHQGAFDLVILDLTMPRLDGREAAKAIKAYQPSVRIVLSSGYHEREVIENPKDLGIVDFLPKPFVIADLRRLIG